ncbi:hypothetical protein RD792_012422 [Penstemon davidsonii]|uniref:Cytochrome P450 n=1 Tax=Penstemon davidsonii TaxID=160366 RepID=A0ABR0CYC3_9LAMI|nr:hypothetical protein RD792_012422 [Penstemon davidsonii]
MDFTAYALLLTCAFCALFYLLWPRKSSKHLPPGPYPLPIIGNLLQLGKNPHHSLTKLSKIYGPLMHLKLGSVHTIVVSSPEIAKQILQKHDHTFPGRKARAVTRAHDHHETSVACLPVGTKWRSLRKICREQMFSTQRLDTSRGLRQEKLQKLRDYVQKCCVNNRVIDIGEAAFVTSLNLISNTLFSLDFADYNTDSSQELKEIVHRLMKVLGSPNVADYFSIFGSFDPQGIKREAEICFGKLLNKFDGIIDSRIQQSVNNSTKKNDLLEALLEISEGNQSELSRNDIKHLLLDLFVAGTETTSGTVEWIMTELLRNPSVMSKAKYELKSVIGENVQVEESNISKLPYLQAVVKESFRYHPPGAFIARNKGENELEINNFVIPKDAGVIINIWAIGRDPSVWSNPDSFEPDRFLNSEIDYKGHNFELLPFGSGRRICPALPLAHRMVHLMVASLIHNYDWKLEKGMAPEEVDINEKFGLSLQKAIPLKAVPFTQ